MNTLPSQGILDRLAAHAPLKELLSRLAAGPFPLDSGGIEGSFAALVVASVSRSLSKASAGPLLVVLPTDQEAESLASDLSIIGIEADLLSWWKTATYRPAALRARAFGERAAVLSRLVLGETRILVASERAFVTPLPSVAEFSPLVFPIEEGGSIDPVALGERLSSYGYLRVPRVSLPGEFALRGEVLDLFMPGDGDAVRVVFEYDKVERLGLFDPAGQAGLKALKRVAVRPMKELVWGPERIAALTAAASSVPGQARPRREGPDGAGSSSEALPLALLLEELVGKGRGPKGEELFYPLAFESARASILEYLGAEAIRDLLHRPRAPRVPGGEPRARNTPGCIARASAGGARASARPPPPLVLGLRGFYLVADRARGRLLPPRRRGALREASPSGIRAPSRIRARASSDRRIEQPRSFFGNVQYFKEELSSLMKAGYEVHVYAESDAQADRIKGLLKDYPVTVGAAGISAGFSLPALKLLVVQENEIFGRRKRVPKSLKTARSAGDRHLRRALARATTSST